MGLLTRKKLNNKSGNIYMKRKKVRELIKKVKFRVRKKVIRECLEQHRKEVKKIQRQHDKEIAAMQDEVKVALRKKANAIRAFNMFRDDRKHTRKFIEEHEPEIDRAIIQLAGLKHIFNKCKYLDYRNVTKDVKVEQKFNKQ